MHDLRHEADRWYKQAENDLAFAKRGVEEGFYSQACFLCQQAGEKAVKALHYLSGKRVVLGHSIQKLLEELDPRFLRAKEFIEAGSRLDQYYIPTRYPNGLPDGAPFEAYSESQAREAVSYAEEILFFCGKSIREMK